MLKDLRLAHPRFAYLGEILHPLFWRITFSASPFNLQKFSDTRLDRIAPAILAISFESSLYSIDISREQFFKRAREQGGKISMPRAGKVFPDWRTGIPEPEIRDAWEIYEKLHLEFVEGIESGRAVSILATAMRACKNAGDIRVTYAYSDYKPHLYGNTIEGMVLLEELNVKDSIHAAQWGDDLLKLTSQTLAESRAKPTELSVTTWNTGLEPWDEMPGWNDMDLSGIRSLSLHPDLHDKVFSYPTPEQVMRLSNVRKGCSDLIGKAGKSLEKLDLGTIGMDWGSHFTDLASPNLRSIELGWTTFDATPFAVWLSSCRKLESLTMECVGAHGSWRPVFEVIRGLLPNGIMLALTEVTFGSGDFDIWMECDTSKQVEYTYDPAGDDDDVVEALEAYLSGSADMSPSLENALLNYEEDES